MKAARSCAGWLVAIASVVAGVGLTYLLRHSSLLDFGPRVNGALPLQQLAGGETQPLARMAVAWLGAGSVAGFALASLARSRIALRMLALAAIAAFLLLLAGAASDAVAISDPLGPHLVPQLSRAGTWVAVALFSAGALGVQLVLRGSGVLAMPRAIRLKGLRAGTAAVSAPRR